MGFSIEDKCRAIIAWATEERDDFDLTMVQSILNQVTVQKRTATDRQEGAIDNIIRSYRIDVDKWC